MSIVGSEGNLTGSYTPVKFLDTLILDNRYKRSLLTTMLNRAHRLSSSSDLFATECDNLKEMFLKLKYPERPLTVQSPEYSSSLKTENRRLMLRGNVVKNRTFSKCGDNSRKIDSAHILKLGRPYGETKHSILRLAEYRFLFEKIDKS